MDKELQEIDGEDLAHSVAYALKRNRKALQRLQPRDDEGHIWAARRIIDQLKLSGVRFFRRPPDYSLRYPGLVINTRPDDESGAWASEVLHSSADSAKPLGYSLGEPFPRD